jgi:hypothetical protein
MSFQSFRLAMPLALALVSCGPPSIDDICQRFSECPNPEDDLAECKEEGNELANDAIAAGCEAQLDDYLSCLDGVDVCNEETVENACAAEDDALDGCFDPPTDG